MCLVALRFLRSQASLVFCVRLSEGLSAHKSVTASLLYLLLQRSLNEVLLCIAWLEERLVLQAAVSKMLLALLFCHAQTGARYTK